jgi:hypothetical protein
MHVDQISEPGNIGFWHSFKGMLAIQPQASIGITVSCLGIEVVKKIPVALKAGSVSGP